MFLHFLVLTASWLEFLFGKFHMGAENLENFNTPGRPLTEIPFRSIASMVIDTAWFIDTYMHWKPLKRMYVYLTIYCDYFSACGGLWVVHLCFLNIVASHRNENENVIFFPEGYAAGKSPF